MKLVDVHCHLESPHYRENLDTVIADALDAGLVKLITNSIKPDQWDMTRSIAERYDEVEFALGVHPWYCSLSDIPTLDDLPRAREQGAVAIGEIGLDRKVAHPSFSVQERIFRHQLEIAQEIELPVIVHCRGAFNELIGILKNKGPLKAGGVIHSFAGSAELAENLIRYNLSFSIGGILTYRNSKKREKLLRAIYPDHFLLETDSPDIPPVPFTGGVNYPKYIVENLKAAAEILERPMEEVARITTRNAVKIFKLTL